MIGLLILISPAKTIRDFTYDGITTTPRYLNLSKQIIEIMKKLSYEEIKNLCKTSDKLTLQSMNYYRDFCFDDLGIPALFAYHGIQFKAIHPLSFDLNDMEFAQTHLGIISAVYGILRPLDLIYPYRLEMQADLKINGSTNLYEFWNDKLTQSLKKEDIIDLSSIEYSKIINQSLKQTNHYLRIEFYELRNGKYKAISTMVKAARGNMVHWIIKNRIMNKEQIKDYHENGYVYQQDSSNEQYYRFVRAS